MTRRIALAPATLAYVTVLAVTTGVASLVGHRTAESLILDTSSNLHHLVRTPVRALVLSAFWIDSGFGGLAKWAALLVGILGLAEWRLGSARVVVTFAVGHVGATLVSQGLTALAIARGLWARSWADAPDVGASYGFAAVAAALFWLVPRPFRAAYGLGLLAWFLAASHVATADFTTIGHAAALLIGLGVGSPVMMGAWERRTEGRKRLVGTRIPRPTAWPGSNAWPAPSPSSSCPTRWPRSSSARSLRRWAA